MPNIFIIIYSFFAFISLLRYLIYLCISPFYELQKRKVERNTYRVSKRRLEKEIKISVVIPAYNEEVGIESSIKSLLKNSYKSLEIIIVNDGSTDNTNKVIKEYLKKIESRKIYRSKSFKYINRRQNRGKGAALNLGIKKSTGDIIITMDSDTKFEKDAIYKVARYFFNKNISAAVGNIKVKNSNTVIGLLQRVEYTMGFYFKRTHSVMNSEYIIGGAFAVYRRDIFRKYGYFNEKNKTEDMEFSTRLKYMGVKTTFIEDAIAYTEGASDFRGLLKQRLRWRKCSLDVYWTYKGLFCSTNKNHNRFLSWIILPITVISLIELFILPFIIPLLLMYLFENSDIYNIIAWYIFSTFSLSVIYSFGSKKNGLKDYLLIPFFFILIYILIFIEILALYRSIELIIKNNDVVWQNWNRKGVENV